MPMRRALDSLPSKTRKGLDRRLLLGGFSGYAEISTWLAAQGHPVSRTSVGDYAKANRARILSTGLAKGSGLAQAQIRALCLLAAAVHGPASAAQLTSRADRLLLWALASR